MNRSKGLIYIYEFDIDDTSILVDGLSESGVIDVQQAVWIKPRRAGTKAFLLTFNREQAPEHIKIPGEARQTPVYEYKKKPMQCKNCQQYNHTWKRCVSEFPICGKCSDTGHQTSRCPGTRLQCCHCGLQHTAWNKDCQVNVFHSEVISVLQNQKLQRFEATEVVKRRLPNRMSTYSDVVKSGQLIRGLVNNNALPLPNPDRNNQYSCNNVSLE